MQYNSTKNSDMQKALTKSIQRSKEYSKSTKNSGIQKGVNEEQCHTERGKRKAHIDQKNTLITPEFIKTRESQHSVYVERLQEIIGISTEKRQSLEQI